MTVGSGTERDPVLGQLTAPRAEPARQGEPPAPADLARILDAATTVPDHGTLRPWRFVVVTGEGQHRFGEALVAALDEARGPDVPAAARDKMRNKATAAPCSVVLVASPHLESNVAEWEQVASASCTGYAMVLAATTLGYGAVWKSAAVLGGAALVELFDLAPHERLLGWVNLGTPGERGRKGRRDGEGTDLSGVVAVVGPDGRTQPWPAGVEGRPVTSRMAPS